jgi:hypothetical protein
VGNGEGSRVLDLARTVPNLMRKTPDLSRRTPFDEVIDMLLWIQRCGGGRWLPALNLGKVKSLEFFSLKKKKKRMGWREIFFFIKTLDSVTRICNLGVGGGCRCW